MISVILCAAGKGERAGFAENKVLRAYNGLPVLCYSLSAFTQAGADEILIACRKEDEETVLLIDSWRDQAALDAHHKSDLMPQIAALRDKYHLRLRVERYVSEQVE